MKAILISIKPKYVAKILNGEKIIEIRKSFPKCDLPITVYIYCTKHNHYKDSLYEVCEEDGGGYDVDYYAPSEPDFILNGKVVAKFTLNKVEEIKCNLSMRFFTKSFNEKELLEKSCLTVDELFWYLAPQELKAKCCGYAWHISDLQIFDKPKDLNDDEFHKIGFDKYYYSDHSHEGYLQWANKVADLIVHKAPQSWMYCEVEFNEIH